MTSADFRRRVLVVEDEHLLRSLIVSQLRAEGFVVEDAANAAEARAAAKEFTPDFAVLDIDLGGGPSGLVLAESLAQEFPQIGIVFLTHLPEPRLIGLDNRMVPRQAAYLLKERVAEPEVLIRALQAVATRKANPEFRDDRNPDHPLVGISNSQLDVLRLIAAGLSNHEIAAQRETTVRAVENLINRALESAGLDSKETGNSRVMAAREFIRVAGLPAAK